MNLTKNTMLDKLNIANKRNQKFIKNIGPGLFFKLKRFFFCPILYSSYIFKSVFLKNKIVNTKLFWGKNIQIRLIDKNAISLSFFGLLIDEINVTKYFIKNSNENDIFYDIGANHGFYTYLFSDLCREIHSFEPTPAVFSNLSINFNQAKNVFLNKVALSDKIGPAQLYLAKSSGPNTLLEGVAITRNFESNKISIETTTLNVYIKNHNIPTIIKIDVEGAENLVLQGGGDMFREFSPVVVMEVWNDPREMDTNISTRAVDTLRGFGYSSYAIDEDGDSHLISGNLPSGNYVFKKIHQIQ